MVKFIGSLASLATFGLAKPGSTTSGGVCVGGPDYAYTYRNENNDIECTGGSRGHCHWFKGSKSACEANGPYLPPGVSCGADHTKYWNGPGYEVAGHWCNTARGNDLGEGKCVGGPDYAYTYRNEFGDIECTGESRGHCKWFIGDKDACEAQGPALSPAVACGSDHTKYHGGPGYAEAGHWCDTAGGKLYDQTCKADHSIINPPETSRSYSTIWDGDAIGTHHAQSSLNSPQGWSAQYNQAGEYMTIDFGKNTVLGGLAVQARGDDGKYAVGCCRNQWVQSFTVQHWKDGEEWKRNDTPYTNEGEALVVPEQVYEDGKYNEVWFDKVIKARYVRIYVQSWNDHISMRVAGLACNH